MTRFECFFCGRDFSSADAAPAEKVACNYCGSLITAEIEEGEPDDGKSGTV